MDYFFHSLSSLVPDHHPDLKPLPSTVELTPLAALAPPTIYYLAAILLPPFPSKRYELVISILRNLLAAVAGFLFFRLPLRYHVPFSIGLTYQLALVGLYGGCRVLDAFFISPYLFNIIPRRVQYHHAPRQSPSVGSPIGPDADSYFSLHFLQQGGTAVTETATTDEGWPHSWWDRMSWALELELSMRGAGFAWTSADVRHTKYTWRPGVRDRAHSILVHVFPVLLVCWAIIRDVSVHYLQYGADFDNLPLQVRVALIAALGGFLMGAFSFGHSLFAIMVSPLDPHPLSYFPPLYSAKVWELVSVRSFWSYGWHRLFSRLFLVYGVWPGEWIERRLTGKTSDEAADIGKVLGGFVSSGFVHSFAAHTVMGGWNGAWGEAWFFAENGLAVVIEEGVKMAVVARRKQGMKKSGHEAKGNAAAGSLERWYDGVIGRIWWISVLLYTGRNFARGWVKAGLVSEMAGLQKF